MGIQANGMFGGFYKKTGPLIGLRAKGKNRVTALHHPGNKAATEKQLTQQEKFTLLTQFFLPIGNLVAKGFKQYAKRSSALNAACKYNFPHAFLTQGDAVLLNFALLVYSRGNIATANCPSITFTATVSAQFTITFHWLAQSQSLYNQSTDLATFLVYSATKGRLKTAINAASRASLSYTLTVMDVKAGDTLYCYMNFADACSKLSGNSVCVGIVNN